MGMIKNIEKFWWKTEDFRNFRLRTFFTFDSATTTINFSELKISKVFRFPPKFFNIFQHTHKNFKNINGKYRKFSDFQFSHANIFMTYFYIYFYMFLRARIFWHNHRNSITMGQHVPQNLQNTIATSKVSACELKSN